MCWVLRQGFKSSDGETGDYGSEWNDARKWGNRTSLIARSGRRPRPALTPRAMEARTEARKASQRTATVKDRPLGERCITYGSPQLTAGYQSYYQIVETPGAVVIMTEMFHDARIVKMDTRAHPPETVQGWLGDSIGHWEGDTLVVDTTNYRPRAFQSVSSEKLHIIERFTPQDAETLRYEITVDDPDTYVKPWSLMVPLSRSSKPVYSMRCHEGNYSMTGIHSRRPRRRIQTAGFEVSSNTFAGMMVSMKTIARFLSVLLGFGAGFAYSQTVGEPANGSAILKTGRLLDVRKGTYIENAAVWIESTGRIRESRPDRCDQRAARRKSATIIDLSRETRSYLREGLINCRAPAGPVRGFARWLPARHWRRNPKAFSGSRRRC